LNLKHGLVEARFFEKQELPELHFKCFKEAMDKVLS